MRYKDELYRQAREKIDKELDIRYITKELRTLKFMANILLTKYQRFMIPHFRHNVINHVEKVKKVLDLPGSLKLTINECETGKLNAKILKNIDSGMERVAALNQ